MLQNLPDAVGHALKTRRAGMETLMINHVELQHGQDVIALTSPAFENQAPIPRQFTADGAGVSPQLYWSNVPAGTNSVALIVEDADSPTAEPLVHAIAVDLDPRLDGLPEGTMSHQNSSTHLGRNSYLRQAWLPPDPPPGHGAHRYVFQVFALLAGDAFSDTPGRAELATAIRQRGIGSGQLIGIYER